MSSKTESLSIANPHPNKVDVVQKIGLVIASLGVLILFVAWAGVNLDGNIFLWTSIAAMFVGTIIYAFRSYMTVPEGIKNNNNWLNSMTNRGVLGWIAGIVLTGFYVLLYWFPQYLGHGTGIDGANTGLVALFDPLAQVFKGPDAKASQWFVYGSIYTIAILALGIKFIYKYRHSRYQLIRTIVVMISQLFLAYLIPEILDAVHNPTGAYYYGKDLKNMWPLNVYFTDGWYLNNMQHATQQPLGMIFLVWGIVLFLVVTPIITYFVGKRWYCSWVCGCGGLAETAGDPYRHLSDKSLEAWQIERVIINGVIAFVFLMTGLLMYSYFFPGTNFAFGINYFILLGVIGAIMFLFIYLQRKKYPFLKSTKTIVITASIFVIVAIYFYHGSGGGTVKFSSQSFRSWYGFLIGSAFSGVIGVGFYPVLGNRVWCRFGCPLAGYMGLIQRFKSKFRITTNGGQCISCGNCSTYCEQGIDVRWYAQRGQNIVRSSCVGCGICSAVCPRGVLNLENGPEKGRTVAPQAITGSVAQSNN